MNLKKSILLVSTILVATACAKPTVLPQNGKDYAVEHREEELFVYVEYTWRGGKYDDATTLESDFVKWASDQGILVYAMGRYPTSKQWQLGFVANRAPDISEFQGRKVSTLPLKAGDWAVMETTGHTDRLFFLWKKLARTLGKDGHPVQKPVFEVYPDLLKVPLDDDASRGQIRYPLSRQ
jgi:hypothetical protein